jgi:hypothetical protein
VTIVLEERHLLAVTASDAGVNLPQRPSRLGHAFCSNTRFPDNLTSFGCLYMQNDIDVFGEMGGTP